MWHMNFWAYVHITLSLALSNANPGWLIGYFRPQAFSASHDPYVESSGNTFQPA
jgi:hypothetical protein